MTAGGDKVRAQGRRDRAQAIVGLLAVVMLAATGCGSGPDGSADTASEGVPRAGGGAPVGVGYAAAPCPNPIVEGAPVIDLGSGFECGYLTVPENRVRPSGRTIKLPVARAKATSPHPRPDPLVYLAGGPGDSGLAAAAARIRAGWNADRDVIFLDQRGTMLAQPFLACPEIDIFVKSALSMAPTSSQFASGSVDAVQTCHDRLSADGWDLSAYNSSENAADVADLRIALGIAEWNLYGLAYGADLALKVVRDHPQGVRSVVLDSVMSPRQNQLDELWPSAARGYRAVFDACVSDIACRSAFPDARGEFRTLVSQLTVRPRVVRVDDPSTGEIVDVVFDGYTFANLVVLASLTPGDLSAVPSIVHNLATGDGKEAAHALLRVRPPGGVTGYGLQFGVLCREQAPFTDLERVRAAAKQALPDFPDPVLALLPRVPAIFRDCGVWDVPAESGVDRGQTRSDVPALLLQGGLDGLSPRSGAVAASAGLPRSQILVFPGAGHDVMIWSQDCAVTILRNFLDQPIGGYDDTCLRSVDLPKFQVP
jgi:pimeloyl-ACP methyl ester carboxylesterase